MITTISAHSRFRLSAVYKFLPEVYAEMNPENLFSSRFSQAYRIWADSIFSRAVTIVP